MTINKEHVVDIEQLVEDYHGFIDYINEQYNVKISFPEQRVLNEVLTLHFKGTLDNRIFSLFRQMTDDWEYKLIDLLSTEKLEEEEIVKILNSTRYQFLKTSMHGIVRFLYNGIDPNFTIWEVQVATDNTYVLISSCGDYRIEQWHHEHNVTKLEIKDVVSYDLSHFVGYLQKVFAYQHAPGRIKYKASDRLNVNMSKKSFYAELIKNYVGFQLSENKKDQQRFLNYVDTLGSQMVVNPIDIEAKLLSLDSFFELEVRHQLDKMSDYKQVTSFTITGEEIVINFGSYKSNERKTMSYEELELQAAEANGDYIPERQRKTRG